MAFFHVLTLIILALLLLWWFKKSIRQRIFACCTTIKPWLQSERPIPGVLYEQGKSYNMWMHFNAPDAVVEHLTMDTNLKQD